MGASIELLDLALRIPPWEPMHALTPAEIHRTRLATQDQPGPVRNETVATSPALPPTAAPVPRATSGVQASPISEQRWAMVERDGVSSLARRHPLTVGGDEIGSFDLMLACSADGESYDVRYSERRRAGEDMPLAGEVAQVTVVIGRRPTQLKVIASERNDTQQLVTYAAGRVSAKLIAAFAATGHRSMTVETKTAGVATAIRIGNTGAPHALPRLTDLCKKGPGMRAEQPLRKVGGLASAAR
jgi:hypothetical protein